MSTQVAILGVGVLGGRAAREIVSGSSQRVSLGTGRSERRGELERAFADSAEVSDRDGAVSATTKVVVLTGGSSEHFELARTHLEAGRHVITTTGSFEGASALLALDELAIEMGQTLVIGATFSPGLTDVLSAYAHRWFDEVDEVRFARHGAGGGPRCQEETISALARRPHVLRDGSFSRRPTGSGRELCWFPDPIGGRDAFLTDTAEPVLAQWSDRAIERASARQTARSPLSLRSVLSRLGPSRSTMGEGGVGAVRVELRGSASSQRTSVVLGCLDRPAVAAGALIAELVDVLLAGGHARGAVTAGTLTDPTLILGRLRRRGVRVARLGPELVTTAS